MRATPGAQERKAKHPCVAMLALRPLVMHTSAQLLSIASGHADHVPMGWKPGAATQPTDHVTYKTRCCLVWVHDMLEQASNALPTAYML